MRPCRRVDCPEDWLASANSNKSRALLLNQDACRRAGASNLNLFAEIIPRSADETTQSAVRARLRGSVARYERPLEPGAVAYDWDTNQ